MLGESREWQLTHAVSRLLTVQVRVPTSMPVLLSQM